MIHYRLRNCDKAFTPATFAYELPPASLFMDMITLGEPVINFPFSVTYVHPKDSYSKAIGRAKAIEYGIHPTRFNCTKITLGEGRAHFNLNLHGTVLICQVSVDFIKEKVRMEWIDFA